MGTVVEEVRARRKRIETALHEAAQEYRNAFSETDPKKMNDRRELAHARLCQAAKSYGDLAGE